MTDNSAETARLIERRIADLQSANAVYYEMDRDTSGIRERNDREIEWLKRIVSPDDDSSPDEPVLGEKWQAEAEKQFKPTVSRDREAIAKIIDSWPWSFEPWNDNWRAVVADRKAEALTKADAILSLTPSGSGAEAMREALEAIAEMCPATCEMTLAHEMAGMAQEALQALAALPVPGEQSEDGKYDVRFHENVLDQLSAPSEAPPATNAGDGKRAWPAGCFDTESCTRHKRCMYIKSRFENSDIVPAIEAAKPLSPVLVQLVQTRCEQPVLSGHDGSEAKSELISIAGELDDIEVDENGLCKWTDVANAQTHILARLRGLVLHQAADDGGRS